METTDRGFKKADPIPGDYGGTIQVYESSSVAPKIWCKVTEANDLNAAAVGDDSAGYHDATILLSHEKAKVLVEQIVELVDGELFADEAILAQAAILVQALDELWIWSYPKDDDVVISQRWKDRLELRNRIAPTAGLTAVRWF